VNSEARGRWHVLRCTPVRTSAVINDATPEAIHPQGDHLKTRGGRVLLRAADQSRPGPLPGGDGRGRRHEKRFGTEQSSPANGADMAVAYYEVAMNGNCDSRSARTRCHHVLRSAGRVLFGTILGATYYHRLPLCASKCNGLQTGRDCSKFRCRH
jgi:hypothetical protein